MAVMPPVARGEPLLFHGLEESHMTSASGSVNFGRFGVATKLGVFGRDWSTPSHQATCGALALMPGKQLASLVLSPSLFLGSSSAASSKIFLTDNSITHVLSIGAYPSRSRRLDGVAYHRLALNDSISSSISKIVDTACKIIDEAIASNEGTGTILVHCALGISRSPTIVAAYLMKQKGMTLKAALKMMVSVRPQINPNTGFLQQLKEMEMKLYGCCSLEVDEFPRREGDRLALFESDNQKSNQTSHRPGMRLRPRPLRPASSSTYRKMDSHLAHPT